MPSLATAKLIAYGVAALLLIGLILGLRHYKSLADDRGAKLATICQVTRDASGHKSLRCADVPAQITFMGESIAALSNSLKVQNAAVASLGAQSEREKAAAAQASQKADKRAQGAEATATRLEASSRVQRPPSASGAACEASKTVQESWR